MSTSKSPTTICLPAHILDAHISPRAREVLMLLASQTTAQSPTVWVCHAAIAGKLRCSAITVKRAIQKLVEAKLIDETGDLHERHYKFYRVRWSLKVVTPAKGAPCAGMTKKKPRSAPMESPEPTPKTTEIAPPPHPAIDHAALLKHKDIAYFAKVAQEIHQENLQRYRMDLLSLERQEREARQDKQRG